MDMNRLDYEQKITDLLDEACSKLSSAEFDKLLNRVEETINNYE